MSEPLSLQFEVREAALGDVPGIAGREDRLLVLICPPGSARRLLSLAGVDDLFALYETREEAAAAHSSQ